MVRSKFQPGAETGHYHDTLGVSGDRTGEQRVRLLGPYTINFDTPDVTTEGVLLDPLGEGVAVITSWALVDTVFAPASAVELYIQAMNADRSARGTFSGYMATSLSVNGIANQSIVNPMRMGVMDTDCFLGVFLDLTGGPLTAGSARVYVLIAEPA